jgi:hypothetical protein
MAAYIMKGFRFCAAFSDFFRCTLGDPRQAELKPVNYLGYISIVIALKCQ